ncbi:MAG: hypothetical protein FWC40_07495 [Proteobacteria bacterium]|nr:hypothetical protein [Pseudomonadota bacterium]
MRFPAHRLFIVAILTGSLSQANAQTPYSEQTSQTFDPKTVSAPPMDEHALVYTPPRPQGARAITSKSQCAEAKGEWGSSGLSQLDAVGTNQKLSAMGCRIEDKREGLWTIVSAAKVKALTAHDTISGEDALGRLWFVQDQEQGWAALYHGPKLSTKMLAHFKDGKRHGASLTWSIDGVLLKAENYSMDVLDGRFEEYAANCLPGILGQYVQGKRTGIWEFYAGSGLMGYKIDYGRTTVPEGWALDSALSVVWSEEFDIIKGSKIAEGYRLYRGDEDDSPPTRVGSWQHYTSEGNRWFSVWHRADGYIDDKKLEELCAPYRSYQFNYGAASVDCVRDDEVKRKLQYYASGELWYTVDMKDGFESGERIEYHPTGEVLAKYKMVDDVPRGEAIFYHRDGTVMGSSTLPLSTGEWTAYWPMGVPRETGRYRRGAKVGDWYYYHENGAKQRHESYVNGQLEGTYEEWFQSGLLSQTYQFAGGTLEGRAAGYYSYGDLGWEMELKQGMPTGVGREFSGTGALLKLTTFEPQESPYFAYLKEFYPSGNLRAEGHTISLQGTRAGSWKFYSLNGKFWREIPYKQGKPAIEEAIACYNIIGHDFVVDEEKREIGCNACRVNRVVPQAPGADRSGPWQWYSESGVIEKEGSIRFGIMDSDWRFYYPSGNKMLEGTYELGKNVGKWVGYYDGGTEKFDGAYDEDGKENGLWKTFFPNAAHQVSSAGAFVHGKRHGAWQWFYENGQVRDEGDFEHGNETGVWTQYHDNGRKAGQGPFVDGKRHGEWTWWRDNGDIWRTAKYANGKEVI